MFLIDKDFYLNEKGWISDGSKPKNESIVLCRYIGFVKCIYRSDCKLGEFFAIDGKKFDYSYHDAWKLLEEKNNI